MNRIEKIVRGVDDEVYDAAELMQRVANDLMQVVTSTVDADDPGDVMDRIDTYSDEFDDLISQLKLTRHFLAEQTEAIYQESK